MFEEIKKYINDDKDFKVKKEYQELLFSVFLDKDKSKGLYKIIHSVHKAIEDFLEEPNHENIDNLIWFKKFLDGFNER